MHDVRMPGEDRNPRTYTRLSYQSSCTRKPGTRCPCPAGSKEAGQDGHRGETAPGPRFSARRRRPPHALTTHVVAGGQKPNNTASSQRYRADLFPLRVFYSPPSRHDTRVRTARNQPVTVQTVAAQYGRLPATGMYEVFGPLSTGFWNLPTNKTLRHKTIDIKQL